MYRTLNSFINGLNHSQTMDGFVGQPSGSGHTTAGTPIADQAMEMLSYNRKVDNVFNVFHTLKMNEKKEVEIGICVNKMKRLFDWTDSEKTDFWSDTNTKKTKKFKNSVCKENKDPKRSFDRFGDDLCELILRYLPIEDKFRFRCLSKQINCLILVNQDVMKLNRSGNLYKYFITKVNRNSYGYGLGNGVNPRIFGHCLRQLKNLSEISILDWIKVDSTLLRIIADDCHHLRRLEIRLNDDISEKSIEYFGEKCGHRLKSLSFGPAGFFEPKSFFWARKIGHFLSFTPNLISLNVKRLERNYLFKPNIQSEILLPKLREIAFNEYNDGVVVEMQKRYSHQLVALTISLYQKASSTTEGSLRVVSGLASLTRLELLRLSLDTNEDKSKICEALARTAECLPLLRRLDFRIQCFNKKQDYGLMSTFSAFTQLSRLNIVLDDIPSHKSFADFKQLPQLKSLSIRSNCLSDKHFRSISECLPRLESLTVDTSKVLGNSSLRHISQMTGLKSLRICCHPLCVTPKMTARGLKQVDNCPRVKVKLRHIYQTRDVLLRVTSDTIQSFKSNAQQFPRIEFYYKFNTNRVDFFLELIKDCPKNLQIALGWSRL